MKIQEDKVDRMSEEFSDLNMESVKLHDSINEMAQELQSQKQLMEGQFDESEVRNIVLFKGGLLLASI